MFSTLGMKSEKHMALKVWIPEDVLMDHSLNSLNISISGACFARMHAYCRPADILAVTGNMDEEHRTSRTLYPVLSTDDAGKRAGVDTDITGLFLVLY